MEDKNNNIDIFKDIDNPFERSESDLWASISKETIEKEEAKVVSLNRWSKYLVAASIALLLGLISLINLYTVNIEIQKGEQMVHVLPDNSSININSDSKISYKPLKWVFTRELEFEGEAFFEVEKGSNFKVISINGISEVLGTSFNINSRDKSYEVYCKTGKVRVSSRNYNKEISPGEIAILNYNNSDIDVNKIDSKGVLAWADGKFNFTSSSIIDVVKELELRYNIEINLKLEDESAYEYTAYFEKFKSVDQSLQLICKSLNLKLEKTSDRVYSVYEAK